METVDIAVKPDELEHIGIGAVAQREDPSRAVVGIRKLTRIEIKSDDIDPVRVRQIRGSSGEARNVASKVRWIDQYQYAVAGAARTIVKCDRDTRGCIELDGAASDHGAAAGHRVLYMQRAAITRLEHAEIDEAIGIGHRISDVNGATPRGFLIPEHPFWCAESSPALLPADKRQAHFH